VDIPFSPTGYYYHRRGGFYGMMYLYAISGPTSGFLLSNRASDPILIDIPCEYSSYKQLRFFILAQDPEIITHMISQNQFLLTPMYSVVENAINVDPQDYDLSSAIPKTCMMVDLMVSHSITDGISVIIADSNGNQQTIYIDGISVIIADSNGNQQTIYINGYQQIPVSIPIFNGQRYITAYAPVEDSQYSIALKGFYVS
jgi:hypothetical protein